MELTWRSITPYFPHIIYIVALILLLEQLSYLKKKRFLPNPPLVLPFVGNAISLGSDPTKFWDRYCACAKSIGLGISGNYIIGRYILYVYSSDISHKIRQCPPHSSTATAKLEVTCLISSSPHRTRRCRRCCGQ